MKRFFFRQLLPLILLATAFLLPGAAAGWAGDAAGGAAGEEKRAVEDAARTYLDAEIRGDHKVIYGMLAPSSAYRKLRSYEAYVAEAEASKIRIIKYRVLNVTGIRDNHDRKAYPGVERFAQVEVDVVIFYGDTKTYDEVNFSFTFIREGGKWFKG
jgi:hypothetical protein